jgi:hypothetical protein
MDLLVKEKGDRLLLEIKRIGDKLGVAPLGDLKCC